MDCYVVVPNVTHHSSKTNIFPPNSNPISSNYMPRFQQIEGQARNLHHRNELPLLMKKRPSSLKIPIAISFDNSVSNSARDRIDEVELELELEDVYGVYCKKGIARARLEDRFSAIVNNNVHGHPKEAFFGIFDGHGGPKAAEFAAEKLGDNILNHVRREIDGKKLTEEKIRDGYLTTDQEFLKGNSSGGACCVTALIKEGNLIVSNLGDCRAVISKCGVAKPLTLDHTPSREDEKTRIESKGGYVDCCNGVWRIRSSLAVSRALGDRHLKQWVIAEPDTKILNIIKSDFEFLILASDGLWNKVSNQEAIDVIQPFFKSGSNKLQLKDACRKLVEMSISRGSNDDISVMVINLGQFAS